MMTGSPAFSVIGVPLGISRASTSRETVASLRICIMPLRFPCAGPRTRSRSVAPSLASAAFSVCQGSVAHLTRTGYSRTPEKTASLPRSAAPSAWPWPVIRSWNRSNRASASARVLPLTLSVIIDAEAVEIAQPAPWNATSRTRSPSSVR